MSYSDLNARKRQNQMGGNRNNLKDGYVDIKVSKDRTEAEALVRLIGIPYAFMQYQARKLDENKNRVDVDFPDKEEKSKWTRNWISPDTEDDRYPVDPWAEDGYVGSLRYAQNVLLRHDDGSFSVKILEKGKMLFNQFTDIEDLNYRRNQTRNKNFVTCLGGEETHDILIVAQFNQKKPLVADLKVSIEPEVRAITEEEIEALKKIGCPTDEELDELFSREPHLEAYPRWFWYGFQLSRIYKPDLYPSNGDGVSSGRTTTSRGELDMSAAQSDDDDDEGESKEPEVKRVEPARTAAKSEPASPAKTAAKQKAPVAVKEQVTDEEDGAFDADATDEDW